MGRVIPAFTQMFDGEGNPLANGWLQFNASGSNNTPKDTYFDAVYQIPNENPLQLDAEGRVPSVFGVGDYRVISYINDPEDEDSPGEMIQMFDPVTAQGATESGGGSGAVFDAWSSTVTYELGSIVERDLGYYRSLINANLGLDPLLETSSWEQIDFLAYWNSAVTYETGDLVYYLDNLYLSLVDSNVGQTPTTSPEWWRAVASGCKGYNLQTTSFSITSALREYLIMLGPAATADATFDLPAMDAATDKFCLWICNASDYVLTIDAAGGAGIWLNTGGTLDITGGAIVQLGYNSYLNCWLPISNVGPTLGNQDIGTATYPVLDLHANNILSDTMTLAVSLAVDTVNVSTLRVPSDEFIYLGDADDISLSHTSLTPAFDINLAASNYLNIISDGVTFWTIDPSGALYPGATNPLPDLGSAANSLNYIYTDNISLPDSGVAYFGTDDDLQITFNGTTSRIESSSALYIDSTDFYVYISGVQAFRISSGGDTVISGDLLGVETLRLGDTSQLVLSHNASNAFFNNTVGVTYFQASGNNVFSYTQGLDVTFYDEVFILNNNLLYFGSSSQSYISYNTATTALRIVTLTASDIDIYTNSALRWTIDSAGTMYPASLLNIGSTTNLVNALFATYLYTNEIHTNALTTPLYFGFGSGIYFHVVNAYQYNDGTNERYAMQIYNPDTGYTFLFTSNPGTI